MLRFSMVFVACMAMGMLFGCGKDYAGDFCKRVGECYEKAGEVKNVAKCTRTFDEIIEDADVHGCGSEFEDALACYEGVSSCKELLESIENDEVPLECRALANAYEECSQ